MATGSQRWFDARKRSFWSGGMGWIKLGLTASYLRRGEASSYEHQPQEQCGPLMKSWGIVYDDLTRLRDPRHHLYGLTLKCLGLCPDDGSLLSAVVDESPHVTGHVDKGDASLTVVLLRRVRDPNTGLFPGGGSEFLMAELNAYLRTHFPADLPGDPPDDIIFIFDGYKMHCLCEGWDPATGLPTLRPGAAIGLHTIGVYVTALLLPLLLLLPALLLLLLLLLPLPLLLPPPLPAPPLH